MPTLPTYGGPHITAAPIPDVHLSPSTPGGAFEKAAPNLAGPATSLEDIAQKAKRDANQVAVNDADNQLAAMQNALLYDPEKGALNQHGKNAFSVPETVQSAWQAHVGDVLNGLANDDQKRVVQQLAAQRGQQMQELTLRHVAGEMTTYDQQTTKATLDNATDDAVANYGVNPGAVDHAFAKQQAVAQDYVTRHGLSPEAAQQFIDGTRSNTHSAIIKKLIAEGQDQSAESYYAQHKDEITGTDQVPLEQSLKIGSTMGAAQRLTDPILKNPATTLTDARQQVKDATAENPEVRQSALDMVDREFASRETALIQQQRQSSATLATAIEQSGGNIEAVIRQHPNEWAGLSEPERSGQRRYAMSIASGETIQTNWSRYYQLRQQATNDPEAFAKLNLMRDRGNLGNGELHELIGLQQEMGTGTPDPRITQYRTQEQVIRGTLEPLSIGQAKNGVWTYGDPRVVTFTRQFEDERQAQEVAKGRKLTTPEMQSIADALALKLPTAQGGDAQSVFEAPPGARLVLGLSDVPLADQRNIAAQLQRRGITVTPKLILDTYTRGLGYLQGDKLVPGLATP